MGGVTRGAAFGVAGGLGAAGLTGVAPARAGAGDGARHAPAGAATVTVRGVALDRADEAGGTLSVSFGKQDRPGRLVDVPLGAGVRVVASHVRPGSVNHLPFGREYARRLQGKVACDRRASRRSHHVTRRSCHE